MTRKDFDILSNMKNVLILHGTDAQPEHNWFPSLKQLLEEREYETWVPQLPNAHRPNSDIYNQFILESNWKFNEDSLIIGHSSGAVATLALLEALPENVCIETAVLVGVFRGSLGRDSLADLRTEPFDLDKVRRTAKEIIILHSDNDPFCPLEDAEYYAQELGAKLIVIPGAQHFTPSKGGEEYRKGDFIIKALD